MIFDLIKLARPKQWHKGAFVLIGPFYATAAGKPADWIGAAIAFLAFGLASSGCYVINDVRDAEADRGHPRKKNRPVASGRVPPATAWAFAFILLALAATVIAARAVLIPGGASAHWAWLAFWVALYTVNVTAYSMGMKHVAVLDVISLASGFVIRVLGGCAAAAVEPSTWLLNCTLFVSMFLAFGKRLGERRTMGNAEAAAGVRAVHAVYTDEILRMFLVVTGVACLGTYAAYVQAQEHQYASHSPQGVVGGWGFNLLWPTILPATYGLLRCVVQVERGKYDDPTELAMHDRPFQAAAALFGLFTVLAVILSHP